MARSIDLLARLTRRAFLRQEDHADAVFAGRRQLDTLLGHFGAVEFVRNLDQQTGAVAHQRIGTHRAAVIDVFEDLQTLSHDAVRLVALDMGNKADTPGIVFGIGIQTGFNGCPDFLGSGRAGGGSIAWGTSFPEVA